MAGTTRGADIETTAKQHLAYSMYRGLLGNFHEKANVMVDSLPRATVVRQDQGVAHHIESMV